MKHLFEARPGLYNFISRSFQIPSNVKACRFSYASAPGSTFAADDPDYGPSHPSAPASSFAVDDPDYGFQPYVARSYCDEDELPEDPLPGARHSWSGP